MRCTILLIYELIYKLMSICDTLEMRTWNVDLVNW